MRRVARMLLPLVLVLAAAPAGAKPITHADAYEHYRLQAGVLAFTIGRCEVYLDAGSVSQFEASLPTLADPATFAGKAPLMLELFAEALRRGRAVGAKQWSAEDCDGMIEEQRFRVRAALDLYQLTDPDR